jgi:hypothetical protein
LFAGSSFGFARAARLRRRSLHLGVSRGDLGAHPRCSNRSSAFEKERPLTRPMYLSGLRPLHLCGTRLEGGHQGLSRRYGQLEGEPLEWALPQKPALTAVVLVVSGSVGERLPRHCAALAQTIATIATGALGVGRLATAMTTSQQPKRRCFTGSTHTNLRDGKSLRCPPSRRVPHKWSGRRPISTRAAERPSFSNAEDLSEQRGWAPKALRLTPPPESTKNLS